MAYDPKTAQTGYFAIDAVLVHTDPIIEDLTLDNETLVTTPEHPFFTQEHGFTAAGKLSVGDHVRKADGSFGVVKALKLVAQAQRMYNLTVHTAHTFFVGIKRWLVHNTCDITYYGPDEVTYKGNTVQRPQGAKAVLKSPLVDGGAVTFSRPEWYPEGTDRGHLIGRRFGGSRNEPKNFVPLYANGNRGAMRVAENEIAQDVLAGKTIILEVIPKYPGDSPIPNEIQISASDGKTSKTWIIPN